MAKTRVDAAFGTRNHASPCAGMCCHRECIHVYPEDTPFPSALFFAFVEGKPLHVVAAFDKTEKKVYIITAYEPSLEVFESDFKTRKTP